MRAQCAWRPEVCVFMCVCVCVCAYVLCVHMRVGNTQRGSCGDISVHRVCGREQHRVFVREQRC